MKKSIAGIVAQREGVHSEMKDKGLAQSPNFREPFLSEAKSQSPTNDKLFDIDPTTTSRDAITK